MKKIIIAVTLPLLVAWSGLGFANTCYTVEGEVKTVNISDTTQVGSIELVLLDEGDNEAFRETGFLVGNVTEAGSLPKPTLLTHTALFSGGSFITQDDKAYVTGVRKLSEDGIPCSFFINEEITDIVLGTGFFADVESADIYADGYISACIADGENENEFELSGTLCTD